MKYMHTMNIRIYIPLGVCLWGVGMWNPECWVADDGRFFFGIFVLVWLMQKK